jgi:CHASE1-domain containing sensor protein
LALPALVVAVGLIMTAAGGFQIEQARLANERMRFDGVVDQANDAVAGRLGTYIAVLRAGAGLFAASEDVSLAEFRAFAERVELTRRYRGIQGIGYSVRVSPGDAEKLIARMHAEGVSNFKLQNPDGEVHAIVYLEPADLRNAVALGFNMHRFPVRREAMDRARDTGLPALSGKVEVVQEVAQDKQAGFLVYEPVYRGGIVPGTLAERRGKLQGFVYEPFRAGDLLKSV